MTKNNQGAQAAKGKPYLTGSPVDQQTPKAALSLFATLLMMGFIYLLLGGMFGGNGWYAVVLNILLLAVTWTIYYSLGQSAGTIAVNTGEIMYRRQETDREITPAERARCYHPLKGFIIGLLATAPVFLMTLVFALITKRQMYTPGPLPSWVTAMASRPDVLEPLNVYTRTVSVDAESVLRIAVRMLVMPWINLFGQGSADRLLLIERLAPLLILLPGLCYGIGYLMGTQERARVHANIEEGKRKQRKKAARARRVKQRAAASRSRGPERLN